MTQKGFLKNLNRKDDESCQKGTIVKMTKIEKKSIQEQVLSGSGMFAKYRLITVGKGGNLNLFFHELISFFIIPIQGQLGVFFRSKLFPLLVKKIGKSVCIGANCTIRNGKQIVFGDRVVIGHRVTLDVKPGDNRILLNNDVNIGNRVIFNCSGGTIKIGEGTIIEEHCRLGSLQGLTIGRHCTVGKKSSVVGAGHATDDLVKPIMHQPVTCMGPSFIGDDVTIGERVTILDGISIGNNVTVRPDSLVINDIPDGYHVAGIPAKIVEIESDAKQIL